MDITKNIINTNIITVSQYITFLAFSYVLDELDTVVDVDVVDVTGYIDNYLYY